MSEQSVLNELLDLSDHQEANMGRSQWTIFKAFLPVYLKLRWSKVWSYIILILIVLNTLFMGLMTDPPIIRDNETSRSDDGLHFFNNVFTFYVLDDDGIFRPAATWFYTSDDKLKKVVQDFIYYPYFIDNKEDFETMVKENYSGKVFYDFSNLIDKQKMDFYFKSDSIDNEKVTQLKYATSKLYSAYKNVNISYDFDKFSHLNYISYSSGMFSLILSLLSGLLFLLSFPEIIEFQESKSFLLLTISGANEFTLWSVFLLPEIIYTAVFSIIEAILFGKVFKCYGKNSVFLIFVLFFLLFLSIYFLMLAFIPLIRKGSHYKWYVLIILFLGSGLGSYGMMFSSNDSHLNEDVARLLEYFFPHVGICMSLINLDFFYVTNRTLSFSTIDQGLYISFSKIIEITFITMAIYIFIFIFFQLFLPRVAGTPPIGFKNIFSGNHWKKLFIKASNKRYDFSQPFVTVKNISKTYSAKSGKVHALNNASFSIGQKEIIVLIGPNGCGKSTLLNSMTGTIDCDGGELYIFGQRAELGFSEMQSCIGITFQDNVLIEKLTTYDHLKFFGKLRGASESTIEKDIQKLESSLELGKIINMEAHKLSGGQKRKLCIALAFIGSPACVILDEPTAGIDVTTRQIIWKAISQFKDTTCLVTSHSLEEAESVATRLFVMKSGQLVFQDTASKLRQEYHCGYRICTIGEHANMEELLNLCESKIQGSSFDDERKDSVLVPVSDNFPDLLELVEQKKNELNIEGFTVTVEQLEHVILRIIADEE